MNHRKTKLQTGARVALGLLFSVFGLNGFLHFIPQPPHAGGAGEFLGALAATGYMFPLIKGTEVVAGLLLLAGRAVPLALTLLAPVVVNILAFHLFLEPASLPIPILTLVLGIYLAWADRKAFQPLFGASSPETKRAAHPAGAHATSAA